MQVFLAMLVGYLATAAVSMVGRVLIALGVGIAVYSGLSVMLSGVETQVVTALGAVPARAVEVLSAAKVDVCCKIILGAYTARLVLQGLTNGSITKIFMKTA